MHPLNLCTFSFAGISFCHITLSPCLQVGFTFALIGFECPVTIPLMLISERLLGRLLTNIRLVPEGTASVTMSMIRLCCPRPFLCNSRFFPCCSLSSSPRCFRTSQSDDASRVGLGSSDLRNSTTTCIPLTQGCNCCSVGMFYPLDSSRVPSRIIPSKVAVVVCMYVDHASSFGDCRSSGGIVQAVKSQQTAGPARSRVTAARKVLTLCFAGGWWKSSVSQRVTVDCLVTSKARF